jgi:5-methylcytosine-specific restriction endonuclease McrA
MEHIVPSSKGGEDSWTNLVAACKACNNRKADRTPEAAGMKLHYVPYVPNRYEAFILSNRKILADQMEFLLQGVPKSSRAHRAT